MWSTVGHDGAVRALSRSLEQGRASHAYLFVGPRSVGKMHLALNFAQALNCTGSADVAGRPCGVCAQCRRIMAGKHADVRVVGLPQGNDGTARKTIPIEAIKDMQAEAGLQPFEGARRVVIIDGADRLSPDAGNRFLKTLEEPPAAVSLVLLAEDEGDVLETILSRCQTIRLHPVPRQTIEQYLVAQAQVDPERAKVLAAMADGRIGWAIRVAKSEDLVEGRQEAIDQIEGLAAMPYYERLDIARAMADGFTRKRDEVFEWLSLLEQFWRDLLLAKGGQSMAVVNIDRADALDALAAGLSEAQIASGLHLAAETADSLEKNANPRLALDVLMLGLPVVRARA